jgi:hypothetical protein
MPTMLTPGQKTRRYALSPVLGFFDTKLPPQSLNVTSSTCQPFSFSRRVIFAYPYSRMLVGVPAKGSLRLCTRGRPIFCSFQNYLVFVKYEEPKKLTLTLQICSDVNGLIRWVVELP